ncbi:MAG: hypothetical protein NVV74_22010 [Magnetospirillum sp.]|nr:hypothetical protein [Magnetospirillum sp.]
MNRRSNTMANGTPSSAIEVGSGTGTVAGTGGDDILVAEPQVYVAGFQAVNGSGVTGTARISLDAESLRVQVDATGLEAGQAHEIQIHGLSTGGDTPLDSVALTTSLDADADGFIEPAGGPARGRSGADEPGQSHRRGRRQRACGPDL